MLLAAGQFTNKIGVTKAGGALGMTPLSSYRPWLMTYTSSIGICSALAAFYGGFSLLLVRDESWFGVPLGGVVPRDRHP
jgi:succinate-acetate transporter protein